MEALKCRVSLIEFQSSRIQDALIKYVKINLVGHQETSIPPSGKTVSPGVIQTANEY
jgi:hypothetical protein